MKKVLIVIADYYPQISKKLLASSLKDLIKSYNVKVIRVPGIFEIPVVISRNIKKYDAFVALGCVIKGQTPHFDLICSSVMFGLMEIGIKFKKPVGNGILTCYNKKQAVARISKGSEASQAIIQVLKNVPIK